ncbi:hypothetical protein ACH5RR_003421 [Cinchona calisaya]|uniref:RNase H type-1 domain-containing protein n=1 Tax=Cinchona calisaya TaxID=153742 RepID=A0ABD3AV31_9GENT
MQVQGVGRRMWPSNRVGGSSSGATGGVWSAFGRWEYHLRNSLIFEGKTKEPGHISSSTNQILNDFKQANLPCSRPNEIKQDRGQVRPPPSFLKVNFDSSMFRSSASYGVGVVARKNRGVCVAGMPQRIYRITNLEIAEMVAARKATEFGAKINIAGFILEGDAKRVITICLAEEHNLSTLERGWKICR